MKCGSRCLGFGGGISGSDVAGGAGGGEKTLEDIRGSVVWPTASLPNKNDVVFTGGLHGGTFISNLHLRPLSMVLIQH
jgi:hypothetical protein